MNSNLDLDRPAIVVALVVHWFPYRVKHSVEWFLLRMFVYLVLLQKFDGIHLPIQ